LVEENRRRGRQAPEYELIDTGVFDADRYFDIEVEYAKADVEDILIKVHVTNRGPEPAPIDVLPTVWFRNTWSWHPDLPKPVLARAGGTNTIGLREPKYGARWLHFDEVRLKPDATTVVPQLLFTENDTHAERLYGAPNATPYVKDAFHRCVVDGDRAAVNPDETGTKACARYALMVAPGETVTIRARLNERGPGGAQEFGAASDATFDDRRREADEFYASVIPDTLSEDGRRVARQAFAGLLWSKQYYHYVVKHWLDGDPGQPPPPA